MGAVVTFFKSMGVAAKDLAVGVKQSHSLAKIMVPTGRAAESSKWSLFRTGMKIDKREFWKATQKAWDLLPMKSRLQLGLGAGVASYYGTYKLGQHSVPFDGGGNPNQWVNANASGVGVRMRRRSNG